MSMLPSPFFPTFFTPEEAIIILFGTLFTTFLVPENLMTGFVVTMIKVLPGFLQAMLIINGTWCL